MPASIRHGNDYIVLGFKESAFGVYSGDYSTPDFKIPGVLDFTPSRELIDLTHKTGTIKPQTNSNVPGRYKFDMTLSGEFTPEVEVFIAQIFGATYSSTPSYKLSELRSRDSFIVHRHWGKTNTTADEFVSCTITGFKITGSENEALKFEATFIGVDYKPEISLSGITTYYTVTDDDFEIEPVLMNDVTISTTIGGIGSCFYSFDFGLTLTPDDDKVLYCGKNSLQRMSFMDIQGELSVNGMYDSGGTFTSLEEIGDLNSITVSIDTGSSKPHVLIGHGRVSSPTLADPDKGIFETSATLILGGSETDHTEPITYIEA